MLVEPFTLDVRAGASRIIHFTVRDSGNRVACRLDASYSPNVVVLGELAASRDLTDQTDLIFKAIAIAAFAAIRRAEEMNIRQCFAPIVERMTELATLAVGDPDGANQITTTPTAIRQRLEQIANEQEGFLIPAEVKERIRGNF